MLEHTRSGSTSEINPSMLTSLEWRLIGPFRGGRVVAVAGDPENDLVFYQGASAGGVWKTTSAGMYWQNVSDGFFKTSAVGAIAVANSDPNVIYVGTGESCVRTDSSHGDGVYKSTDAGKTWQNMGLKETRHIARIRIHPQNPQVVFVAALGNPYGPNPERGVYRSIDGGKSWKLVLHKSDKAGAIDLTMDPNNPRILFAAIFETLSSPWNTSSGGPDSGLYKTTDGGETWVDISDNAGLPTGIKGRMAVAVSPPKPGRIWAQIEAEDGGIFRSDDGGSSWQKLTGRKDLWMRAHYYTHFFADTQDPDTCYILSVQAYRSTDGGSSFSTFATPHGDNHDLWIDPRNSQRMIEGNDGGATITLNGGETWSTIYNQPTASFFHLDTDNEFPYKVYGTQMDNSAICVPSQHNSGAIPWKECFQVGSAESGHIAVRPDNPDIVYAGAIGSAPGGGGTLLRYDRHADQTRIITVWPEDEHGTPGGDLKYRFQFHFPTILSPHDANTLYVAANVVFKSQDEGTSWETISPDLTRNDLTHITEQPGGPITTASSPMSNNTGSVVSFVESPHEPGVYWAGSDDGLIHLSMDKGTSWSNVTPSEMKEGTIIRNIEISLHNPATAYVAATRYKLLDRKPFLYKTHDFGATWTLITNGLPEDDFTRVIREDPNHEGLLYVGTETGVYVSFNDGSSWQSLHLNLPVVPVYDMVIKNNDLIAATHGRSFWILDDLTLLHQLMDSPVGSGVSVFKPRPTYRIGAPLRSPGPGLAGINYHRASGDVIAYHSVQKSNGESIRSYLDAGTNPPAGVVITYYLEDAPEGSLVLNFNNSSGDLIRSFSNTFPSSTPVSANKGINQFIWDMKHQGPVSIRKDLGLNMMDPAVAVSASVPPGMYEVQLVVGDITVSQSFEILKDPRVSASQEDFEAQTQLLLDIRDKISETNMAINRLADVRNQAQEWGRLSQNLPGTESITTALASLNDKLSVVELQLVRVLGKNPQKFPPTGLNNKLASLTSVVASADWAPTKQSYDVLVYLSAKVDEQLELLKDIIDKDVVEFQNLLGQTGVPPIIS